MELKKYIDLDNVIKLINQEKYDQATKIIKILIQNNKNNHKYYFWYGRILYKQNKYVSAEEKYLQAINLSNCSVKLYMVHYIFNKNVS